jgi:quercetin dioxygenase-like cupin family protein
MAYKALDAGDIKLTWGTFRMVRHELGGTGFGLNQVDYPPDKVGSVHDETKSGQEEVYYCLSGSGTLTIDGEPVEMRPGRYILVSPDAKRQPAAGPDGVSFICVGGVPGGVYVPWEPPED